MKYGKNIRKNTFKYSKFTIFNYGQNLRKSWHKHRNIFKHNIFQNFNKSKDMKSWAKAKIV